MKKIHILLIGLLSVCTFSCFEDNSNYDLIDIPPVIVEGLETRYDVYTHRDVLSISPTVQDENRYDFYWLLYSANFNVNEGVVPPADTLSLSKKLEYEVMLNPGRYILVFNAVDKQTTVTTKITADVYVSTLNMKGWYLLKEYGDKTDFDFIHENGRTDNWISTYNGKSMDGKAIKAIHVPQMKSSPTSSDLYNTFLVISDKDAAFYRIDNGLQVMDFDHMFFTKPSVKKPQNAFQPMNNNAVVITNDYKMYGMTKGTFFANPAVPGPVKVAPVAGVGSMIFGFDMGSKSVFLSQDGYSFPGIPSNAGELKNTDKEIIWMTGYPGARNVGLILLKQTDGSGRLVKLNTSYGNMAGYSSPFIMDQKTIAASHGLMNADLIAGNYDNDYLYYAKANQVYLTDLASFPEVLQVTLPIGETITSMQHVIYPQRVTASVVPTLSEFVVTSYSNGHYKVWFYEISSTGELRPTQNGPAFEGEGRIVNVNYVEQGNGIRIF